MMKLGIFFYETLQYLISNPIFRWNVNDFLVNQSTRHRYILKESNCIYFDNFNEIMALFVVNREKIQVSVSIQSML